jgi:glycosyltransferase involved in cell wall biosynthesis
MKKIVILSLYPKGIVPGPRFRYEQYLDFLREKFIVRHFSFFSTKGYQNVHRGSSLILLAGSLFKGYVITFFRLLSCLNADYVFVFRDVTPFGPPVFEWIISKVLRKKIIYDFDDAIWLPDINEQSKLKIWLRNPLKTDKIISWAYKVSCGNQFLCEHARLYNKNVVYNPTTIDTIGLHNELKDQDTTDVVMGWTGTHSTLKYIDPLIPVIEKLEKEFKFTFLVICNRNPSYPLKSLKFVPWNKETERDDLLQMNFGIMPLSNDEWSKGKCGFKALQYMALGMPALVSPVGVNSEIVLDGYNGFICHDIKQWEDYMRMLLTDSVLRTRLGKHARETIEKKYSVLSNKKNFLALFE